MLQVARNFTQEKTGGNSKKSWPEALKWISADGQLFVWEKLPFCPPSWRAVRSHEAKATQSNHGDVVIVKDSATVPAKSFIEFVQEGGSGDGVEVSMDVRVWSALPEDIIEKVLAWLPLTSVLRFRSVCRRWNSVLLSGRFASSHSKSSPLRPCFLLCTIGQFACTFDPSLNKWLTLLKPTSPGASVVASTGSLFCLGNQVTECKVLSVCNPITRCLKQLPPMIKVRLIHKVTMIEDRLSNTYRIVVAGEDGLPTPNPHTFNLMTEIFDSSVHSWEIVGDPLPEAKFGSDPGVWFDNSFFCLTEMPYGVVMFDAKVGLWSEVHVSMPSSLSVPSLVTARNRLLMVGRSVTRDPDNQVKSTSVCIWELQSGGTPGSDDKGCYNNYSWVELIKMQKSISSVFLAPLASYSRFVCVGVGNSIFITTHLSPRVLVYDMSNDSWTWLPSDPLFPKNRDFHLLGFSFEPRFDASP